MKQDNMAVLVNGVSQIEYHRGKPLPAHQQRYLDKMDTDMDAGIELQGTHIDQPSALERAQFIAIAMIEAIRNQDEQLAAATCSYLANRLPELKQVRATESADQVSVDLVFNEDQPDNQVHVTFDPGAGKQH